MAHPSTPPAPSTLVPGLPASDRLRSRRRRSRIFLVAGLATGAVAAVGILGRVTGYLVVDAVTGHVAIATTLTLVLLFLSAATAPATRGWRNAARGVIEVGLLVTLLGVGLLSLLGADLGETRYASPDGRSVLVVSEGAAMIDPVWDLSVRQSSWLVARSWPVGCFNGDSPDNYLESVGWTSGSKIRAVASSGTEHLITVDPHDSRPSHTVSVGCYD